MDNNIKIAKELVKLATALLKKEKTASSSYKRINRELIDYINADKTPMGDRMRRFVNKGILNGVFADGLGQGYIEEGSNGFKIPNYAYDYIMKFIKSYKG